MKLSNDEASDLIWDAVAIQDIAEHRWYTEQLVVFKRDDEYWGFVYFDPATEDQEDMERFESDPVQAFRVYPRQVVQTIYEKI